MFKGLKRTALSAIAIYVVIALLHLWLNLGLDVVGLGDSNKIAREDRFRVGFIPVT